MLSTTGDTTESENATSLPAGSSISDISSITRLSQRTQVPADPPEEIVDSDNNEEDNANKPDDSVRSQKSFFPQEIILTLFSFIYLLFQLGLFVSSV